MNSTKISFYLSGFQYAFRDLFSRQELPFMGGIVLNDRCNLNCLHCSVSGRDLPDLTWDEVSCGLRRLYALGMKYLYIEGGEPFLWKDGSKSLEDVLSLARGIGFRYIALYTNGTFPLESSANTLFVSMDGIREVHDAIRGKSHEKILFHITHSSHPKIIVNYTVTNRNKQNIEEFLADMEPIDKIKGYFFYFYTPCKGNDDLRLHPDEKKELINRLLALKVKGFRIVNSRSALLSVANQTWVRPNALSYLYAQNTLYRCCREIGHADICRECGYLGFSEIYQIARLNPGAIMSAFRYY